MEIRFSMTPRLFVMVAFCQVTLMTLLFLLGWQWAVLNPDEPKALAAESAPNMVQKAAATLDADFAKSVSKAASVVEK